MEMAVTGSMVMLFYVLFWLILMAFALLSYVLQSIGLHTIANRRGIKNGWLAWIPIGNMWIMGSISDQYQYVVHGKVTNRRKILVGTVIGYFAVYTLFVVGMIIAMFAMTAMEGAYNDYEFSMATVGIGTILLSVLGGLALVALSIVMTVFLYIAMYDLFCSCERTNGVLYLVLSIVLGIQAFLIFACRKKDDGMPPRKKPAVQGIVEQAEQTPAAATPPEEVPAEEGFAQPEEFVEE